MTNHATQPVTEGEDIYDRWWFKLRDNDVLAEKAFLKLSDGSFRTYIQLLAVANDMKHLGEIRESLGDLAFIIRVPEDELARRLDELERAGLVEVDDGTITIVRRDVHFEGAGLTRSDSKEGRAERKRRQREREAAEQSQCHGDSHGDVTVKTLTLTHSQTKTENVDVHTPYVPGREVVEVPTETTPVHDDADSSARSEKILAGFVDDLEEEADNYFQALDLESDYIPTEQPYSC